MSSGVLALAPGEDTRVYVPAVFGSKSFNLSVYVSTAKYEEMNQVMSGIASCKKREMLLSKHTSCAKTTEKLKGWTHLFFEQNE